MQQEENKWGFQNMTGGLRLCEISSLAACCHKYVAVVFIAYAKSPFWDRVVNSFSQAVFFSEYHYKTVKQKVYLVQE